MCKDLERYEEICNRKKVQLSLQDAVGAHMIVSNRLTDGSEAVSVMRWPLFTTRKIPSTHFC
jgi:hypothetical protein